MDSIRYFMFISRLEKIVLDEIDNVFLQEAFDNFVWKKSKRALAALAGKTKWRGLPIGTTRTLEWTGQLRFSITSRYYHNIKMIYFYPNIKNKIKAIALHFGFTNRFGGVCPPRIYLGFTDKAKEEIKMEAENYYKEELKKNIIDELTKYNIKLIGADSAIIKL